MKQGYLFVETSSSHPGLVRVRTAFESPLLSADRNADTTICYVARFNDLDAARLHAFSGLRHHMIDVDSGLFRVSATEVIAVIESIALSHARVYLDPDMSLQARDQLDRRIEMLRRRKRRVDRVWQTVGWIAASWLAFWALAGI